MLAKVCSAAVNGIEAYPVEVEVNAGFGDTLIVMLSRILPLGPGRKCCTHAGAAGEGADRRAVATREAVTGLH